jgi:hypothetical protein
MDEENSTLMILEGLFCLLIGINSFHKDAKAFVSNFKGYDPKKYYTLYSCNGFSCP